ncbi:carbon starvation protein CstA [Pelobium manganitolerans]|uniref:Carbon starvation protein CstA n=1 Tax=Pelobium manganitolerans TaxID=1842495 RepID=A0A419S219_9SPHI|nr:carbon starvation protein A [Pelobium manganitolerans]RKD12772.1 carbon starvation protein CstA [Pelobium manganitolerans]
MISFLISIFVLIVGYFLISKFCEGIFGVNPNRATPAIAQQDGVDFVPLPVWKIFLIQFLNIAGLGPIFGAVAGAMWGPVAFLWIVLGTLLAGGVHDYFSGMLSIRHKGESITEICGYYLGDNVKHFMRLFSVVLLIMVGTVFIMGPAKILVDIADGFGGTMFWVAIIFIYYVLSTILPIDKLIGKIYPVFGVALLFMAFGILAMMFVNKIQVPEVNFNTLRNFHNQPDSFPIFPFVFVTIACGAISGFHATQSPLMARCMTNEKQGRPVFFGAMVTEGIVALIWAAIGMSFYGGPSDLNAVMTAQKGNAAFVVNEISHSLLGSLGGILALLGVVAAPITSGDTAFRSARIIIADIFKQRQDLLKNRFLISIPLFAIAILLMQLDFGIVWRYFAWTNQTLATIVLWTITIYLYKNKKKYIIALVPASFMTAVITSYLLIAPEGFSLSPAIGCLAGVAVAVLGLIWFYLSARKQKSSNSSYV